MDEKAVTFRACTAKFTTLTDGTRRIYLDLLGDTPYTTDAKLIETQQPGIILECAIVATKEDDRKKRRNTEKTNRNTESPY
jgi:hypothetical protein